MLFWLWLMKLEKIVHSYLYTIDVTNFNWTYDFLPDTYKYLGSCYIIDSENSGLVLFERNFDGKTLRQTTFLVLKTHFEKVCALLNCDLTQHEINKCFVYKKFSLDAHLKSTKSVYTRIKKILQPRWHSDPKRKVYD